MHHKRGRARNRRAGCKLCKPWKRNGVPNQSRDGEKFSDHRRRFAALADDRKYSAEPASGLGSAHGDLGRLLLRFCLGLIGFLHQAGGHHRCGRPVGDALQLGKMAAESA